MVTYRTIYSVKNNGQMETVFCVILRFFGNTTGRI